LQILEGCTQLESLTFTGIFQGHYDANNLLFPFPLRPASLRALDLDALYVEDFPVVTTADLPACKSVKVRHLVICSLIPEELANALSGTTNSVPLKWMCERLTY
jgi:hypothetical protein